MAHALATKSYGRRVRRGGLMLMLGMPFAFVDTSDMWLETRWPRIVVSMAGPLATVAFACIFAVGALLAPNAAIAGICFLVALGLYMNTIYNFNPLIPMDGYYALSDLVGMPNLRQEAMAYAKRGLWHDLKARHMPGPKQLGLALYGGIVTVATFGFIFMGVFAWNTRLGHLVHDHVPAPFDSLLVIGGIMFLMFPLWFVPTSRLYRAIRRRVEGRAAPAPEAVPQPGLEPRTP
jgi:putative peptide zinc metalloprotease protein